MAIVPDRPKQSFGHPIFACLIAFGLFTAGLEKAYVWLDGDLGTSGFMSWFVSGYFDLGRNFLLAPQVLKIDSRLFELADYTAVLFELTWQGAAGGFHGSSRRVLSIS